MTEALRGLSAQIESMQKTIDSQHSTICQINRNGQAQLKKINRLIAVSPCFGTPLRIRLFSTAPSLIAWYQPPVEDYADLFIPHCVGIDFALRGCHELFLFLLQYYPIRHKPMGDGAMYLRKWWQIEFHLTNIILPLLIQHCILCEVFTEKVMSLYKFCPSIHEGCPYCLRQQCIVELMDWENPV